jgi:acetyl/propionyl-CoA carboxylase alpha subunit
MIGKLIVHGRYRAEALEKARAALSRFVLLGLHTNVAFLQRLLADPDVAAGRLHTGLIEEKSELMPDPAPSEELVKRLLGIAALAIPEVRAAADRVPELHAAIGSWRN